VQGLNNKQIYQLEFPPSLIENYVKCISNIYYINITKSAMKFKKDIIDTNKFSESSLALEPIISKVYNDLYKASLKETRQEVADFFNVKPSDDYNLPIKTLFRIYPYYLEESSEIRKKYYELTDTVNSIIKFIEKKIIIEEFNDENHPKFCLKPKDMEHDFKAILERLKKQEESQTQVRQENEEAINRFNERYNQEE